MKHQDVFPLFQYKTVPSKFVNAARIKDVEDWYVKSGWVLVTQSGNVGLPVVTSPSLEKYIISQNLIRVIPRTDDTSGYVYAFLSTWIAKAVLGKDQYGVTVKHINPDYVGEVKIPKIPDDMRAAIHRNIMKAFALREKANQIEDATIRTLESMLTSLKKDSPEDTTKQYVETFELMTNEELEVLDGIEQERNKDFVSWKELKQEASEIKDVK